MPKQLFTDDDRTTLLQAILILSFFIALYGLWLLLQLLWFEIQPLHHGGDGLIYTAVGRGIVNGLVPYKDLFEFKPPGIFLLSAASLWIFDNIWLGNVFQGACYIVILVMLFAPFFKSFKRLLQKPEIHDVLPILSTLLLGLLCVFYLAARAGQFQTESFASMFAVGFLVTISADRMTKIRWFLSGIFLALTIGMKESFLLMSIASMLVLMPLHRYSRRFLIPPIIAIVIGTTTLFLLGYLVPYLNIYLPETLIGRASFNPYPVWTLAFDTIFAWRDLWTFSPLFVIALCVLWTHSLISMTGGWGRPRVLAALLFLSTFFLALYSFGAFIVMRAQSLQHSFDQTPLATDSLFLPVLFSTVLFIVIAFGALSYFFKRKDTFYVLEAFLQHVIAVILSMMTIFVGGMLQQQFGAFIPLFVALILSALNGSMRQKKKISAPSIALLTAAMIASVGLLLLPVRDYSSLLTEQKKAQEISEAQAREIDGLMTACGFDRYVIFGQPNVPYAFTRHSPFGPAFTRTSFTFPVKWRKPPIAYLQNTYRQHLQEAQFLIATSIDVDGKHMIDSTDIPDDAWQVLATDFSRTPPTLRCTISCKWKFDILF